MKNKPFLFSICFFLGIISIKAQVFDTPYGTRKFTNNLYQLDEYIKRNDKGVDFEDTESYTGSPYNHPAYLPGNVYKDGELLATGVGLRYNAVADEIEIKESITSANEGAKLLTKSPDIYVKINNTDIFVFAPYQGGIEGGGYFQVLYEGNKYDLYKKHVKDFKPGKKATTSITRDVPPKFTDSPVYYIVTRDGKFYELPSSRSKKLKVFGKNQEKMKEYVTANKLDLNIEQDLLDTIKYYNSI